MTSAFWPYEEVRFQLINLSKGEFSVSTPWMTSIFTVLPQSQESTALIEWIEHQDDIAAEHLPGLWKALQSLQSLPVAYELVRRDVSFGVDHHKIKKNFHSQTPQSLAKDLQLQHSNTFSQEWTWDIESMMQFAECGSDCYDPISALTVARRFHYLDDRENKMNTIYEHIKTITDLKVRKHTIATVVRQNHYTTEKCASSCPPAAELAQSQKSLIEQFIRDEKSQNAILTNGLKAMNLKPQELPLTEGVQHLMQLFEKCAFYNFLGFCISLDFLEKPKFKEQEALSDILIKSGEATAGRSLQAHKNINHQNENKSFARTLLLNMKPIDGFYLKQALQFAELFSKSTIHISHDLEKNLLNKK